MPENNKRIVPLFTTNAVVHHTHISDCKKERGSSTTTNMDYVSCEYCRNEAIKRKFPNQ